MLARVEIIVSSIYRALRTARTLSRGSNCAGILRLILIRSTDQGSNGSGEVQDDFFPNFASILGEIHSGRRPAEDNWNPLERTCTCLLTGRLAYVIHVRHVITSCPLDSDTLESNKTAGGSPRVSQTRANH